MEQRQVEEGAPDFANPLPTEVVQPSKDYPLVAAVKMNRKRLLQFLAEEEQMKEDHYGPSIHRSWVLPSRDQVVHNSDGLDDLRTID